MCVSVTSDQPLNEINSLIDQMVCKQVNRISCFLYKLVINWSHHNSDICGGQVLNRSNSNNNNNDVDEDEDEIPSQFN